VILELTYTKLYHIIELRKTNKMKERPMRDNTIERVNTKIKIYRKYELYC